MPLAYRDQALASTGGSQHHRAESVVWCNPPFENEAAWALDCSVRHRTGRSEL